MDSAQSLQRRGGLVSLSPSQTPRSSDKSARDLRSADSNSSTKYDKDKGVNVQVIVRCRSVYSKFPCFGFLGLFSLASLADKVDNFSNRGCKLRYLLL